MSFSLDLSFHLIFSALNPPSSLSLLRQLMRLGSPYYLSELSLSLSFSFFWCLLTFALISNITLLGQTVLCLYFVTSYLMKVCLNKRCSSLCNNHFVWGRKRWFSKWFAIISSSSLLKFTFASILSSCLLKF